MSEYRRFVSYFYEYIDGRKQKNAGFAKVELRNGMWRILLRIAAEGSPGSPIQVYGFVREAGDLQGILLGEIRPVQQIAEEWAFRAEAPIGEGKYRLGDLAGIWVEGSGGRRFITVWDDEGIDVERFAAEPLRESVYAGSGLEKQEDSERESDGSDAGGNLPGEAGASKTSESGSDNPGAGVGLPEEEGALEVPESEGDSPGAPEYAAVIEAQSSGADAQNPETGERAEEELGSREKRSNAGTDISGETKATAIEELFRKRAAFCPFDDAEIENCVMILPCDIVRLQQENWKVGRSSFLQHGFYQYRHLLLGRDREGNYILGVPGIRNPQETYMARMFGYERFRESARPDVSQDFGYWCRELQHM